MLSMLFIHLFKKLVQRFFCKLFLFCGCNFGKFIHCQKIGAYDFQLFLRKMFSEDFVYLDGNFIDFFLVVVVNTHV